MAKVPVQKGKIIANQPTNKFKTREEVTSEDHANSKLRRSGQTPTMMTPK